MMELPVETVLLYRGSIITGRVWKRRSSAGPERRTSRRVGAKIEERGKGGEGHHKKTLSEEEKGTGLFIYSNKSAAKRFRIAMNRKRNLELRHRQKETRDKTANEGGRRTQKAMLYYSIGDPEWPTPRTVEKVFGSVNHVI